MRKVLRWPRGAFPLGLRFAQAQDLLDGRRGRRPSDVQAPKRANDYWLAPTRIRAPRQAGPFARVENSAQAIEPGGPTRQQACSARPRALTNLRGPWTAGPRWERGLWPSASVWTVPRCQAPSRHAAPTLSYSERAAPKCATSWAGEALNTKGPAPTRPLPSSPRAAVAPA
jgi:hypothetical protein